MKKLSKPEDFAMSFRVAVVMNKDEHAWVQNVIGTLALFDFNAKSPAGASIRSVVVKSDKYLDKLRVESNNFTEMGFTISIETGGILFLAEAGAGSVDNAALFLAAFLNRWRPTQAIKISWHRLNKVTGRIAKGATLVGPEGITALKSRSYGGMAHT
jgi:hypothetical protein